MRPNLDECCDRGHVEAGLEVCDRRIESRGLPAVTSEVVRGVHSPIFGLNHGTSDVGENGDLRRSQGNLLAGLAQAVQYRVHRFRVVGEWYIQTSAVDAAAGARLLELLQLVYWPANRLVEWASTNGVEIPERSMVKI